MQVSVKQKAAFIDWATPWAVEASRRTGIHWQVIVAQWCHETGFGTSALFITHRNPGGIRRSALTPTAPVAPGGTFRHYDSWGEAMADYVRVMLLGYYTAVRVDAGIGAQIVELGKSPYDAGHYRGSKASNPPGSALRAYLPVIEMLAPLGGMGVLGPQPV